MIIDFLATHKSIRMPVQSTTRQPRFARPLLEHESLSLTSSTCSDFSSGLWRASSGSIKSGDKSWPHRRGSGFRENYRKLRHEEIVIKKEVWPCRLLYSTLSRWKNMASPNHSDGKRNELNEACELFKNHEPSFLYLAWEWRVGYEVHWEFVLTGNWTTSREERGTWVREREMIRKVRSMMYVNKNVKVPWSTAGRIRIPRKSSPKNRSSLSYKLLRSRSTQFGVPPKLKKQIIMNHTVVTNCQPMPAICK